MTDKLISMVDFVLNIEQIYPKEVGQDIDAYWFQKGKIIEVYAKFLKQHLTLGMFVPVSGAGEVLKGKPLSPAPDAEWIRWENEEEEYYKAKSRCLFEGWRHYVEHESLLLTDGKSVLEFWTRGYNRETIELSDGLFTYTLVENCVPHDVTLTPYAKELIYGN